MIFKTTNDYKIVIFATIVLSIVLKLHVFNLEIQGKHTWRQSQTSLNIRNFARHDANILNPRVAHFNDNNSNIHRMEFPLMQWVIGMEHRILGESILVTRISMLLIGLFSLIGMFMLTLLLSNSKLWASISVWILSFSRVFYYQSINPIPDNLALCFSIFFLFYFFEYFSNKNHTSLFLSGLFLSLSALCKLPFILMGIIPFVHFLNLFFSSQKNNKKNWFLLIVVFSLSLIPVVLWYSFAIPNWHGNNITKGIMDDSVSTQLYFHFLSEQLKITIPSVVINYPTAVLVLLGTLIVIAKNKLKDKKVFLLCSGLIIMVLYFFFILKQIREGHDYYHFPFLPFYALLATYALMQLTTLNKGKLYLTYLFLLAMPILCWHKTKNYWNVELAYTNPDFLNYRTELRNAVRNDSNCIMINDHSLYMMPYAIDKQGFIFKNDELPIEWIKDLIQKRLAEYMYSDSRKLESHPEFKDCIQDTIAQYGTVKIYKLKSSI